jgi:Fe-Mn family superoxide dismutase
MKKENSRRQFIRQAGATAGFFLLGMKGFSNIIQNKKNEPNTDAKLVGAFQQQPLPYAYNALEDCIDEKTMEIHYSKHAAAYLKNLNEAVIAEKVDTTVSIESILANITGYSLKMRNNAGGHYNHELFWQCMRPKTANNMPSGKLLAAIEKDLGGWTAFKTQFTEAAKSQFGSGWAWLYIDPIGKLKIGNTPNQDNPLMNLSDLKHKGFPLLCLDVWEHAYYLKYQNRRADYIENWWNLVNWDFVQKRWERE